MDASSGVVAVVVVAADVVAAAGVSMAADVATAAETGSNDVVVEVLAVVAVAAAEPRKEALSFGWRLDSCDSVY